jgi:hypothetical protein
MKNVSFLVLARPQLGRESEWEAWHARHVEDVLRVPGFVSCRRFRVTDFQLSGMPPSWAYAVIYEISSESPQQTLTEMRRRVGTDAMPMSPAGDPAKGLTLLLEEISRHQINV